jgi:hypothetical protein
VLEQAPAPGLELGGGDARKELHVGKE